MFASVNGTRIFFDVDGKQYVPEGRVMKKKPVCFVLHGGPGSDHSAYVPALDPLTDLMQLVYIDYRGNGRSDYPDEETYTIEQNVNDLEALRRYLGFEKIVFLGQSYGGIVAQAYAIAFPENLQALILITTAPSHELFRRAQEELHRRGTPEQIRMADTYLWPGKFPDNETCLAYYQLFIDLYAYKKVPQDAFEESVAREILSYRALNRGFGGDLRTFDFTPHLHAIGCPVLLIGGRHDWVTPIECTREIATHLPCCRMVILEESSHFVFFDQYDESINTIINFIKEEL
ncbi:MAG: alpha/beta hydrolase [Spirochaetaceae bacterium]|jgi:proline iminopeptidase|nr:alpha/beta hydrolase [Spirochaetaceae bacterium]